MITIGDRLKIQERLTAFKFESHVTDKDYIRVNINREIDKEDIERLYGISLAFDTYICLKKTSKGLRVLYM